MLRNSARNFLIGTSPFAGTSFLFYSTQSDPSGNAFGLATPILLLEQVFIWVPALVGASLSLVAMRKYYKSVKIKASSDVEVLKGERDQLLDYLHEVAKTDEQKKYIEIFKRIQE